MVLTFVLAYPISKILDFILGDDLGVIYSKEELSELVRIHSIAKSSGNKKGVIFAW